MNLEGVLSAQSYSLDYIGIGTGVPHRQYSSKRCRECGERLIIDDFNRSYYVLLCDNTKCHIFRQSQGNIAKDHDQPGVLRQIITYPHTYRPGYALEKHQKKINYHKLRDLKIPCRVAARCCSKKLTDFLLNQLTPPHDAKEK